MYPRKQHWDWVDYTDEIKLNWTATSLSSNSASTTPDNPHNVLWNSFHTERHIAVGFLKM